MGEVQHQLQELKMDFKTINQFKKKLHMYSKTSNTEAGALKKDMNVGTGELWRRAVRPQWSHVEMLWCGILSGWQRRDPDL